MAEPFWRQLCSPLRGVAVEPSGFWGFGSGGRRFACPRESRSSLWIKASLLPGGESGIRTHGGLLLGGFQDRCLRPLSHLSWYF